MNLYHKLKARLHDEQTCNGWWSVQEHRKDKSIGCNQLFHRTLHSRVIALNWFSDIWPLFNFSIAPTLGVWWNSTKVILNSEPHLWKDQHRLETTWKNYLYPIGHLIKILLRILKPIVQCFSEESSFQCLVVNGKSPWQNIHVTKSWWMMVSQNENK